MFSLSSYSPDVEATIAARRAVKEGIEQRKRAIRLFLDKEPGAFEYAIASLANFGSQFHKNAWSSFLHSGREQQNIWLESDEVGDAHWSTLVQYSPLFTHPRWRSYLEACK